MIQGDVIHYEIRLRMKKMNNNIRIITYNDLIKLGYAKATAQQIIRQTKLNMVKQGYTIYNNRRLGTVPIEAVEDILGFKLHE